MQNKESLAKSIVAQETWAQLDSWFAAHKAVSCPFPFFDGDSYSMGGVNRSYDVQKNQFFYEYSLIDNACRGSFYFLQVENIGLQQSNQGWQIVEWDNICETSGRESEECLAWRWPSCTGQASLLIRANGFLQEILLVKRPYLSFVGIKQFQD